MLKERCIKTICIFSVGNFLNSRGGGGMKLQLKRNSSSSSSIVIMVQGNNALETG